MTERREIPLPFTQTGNDTRAGHNYHLSSLRAREDRIHFECRPLATS
jgi:hypothetical protein